MQTATIVAAQKDTARRKRIRIVNIVVIRRGVLPHRPASLELTVHLEVERTAGEKRPVSSVLLESSRQRLAPPSVQTASLESIP